VLSDTPIAAAIAGCVIPLSRNNTIWMRWRCIAGIFHRSAVLSRRTSALLHLTIWSPESDGASESHLGQQKQPAVYAAHLAKNPRFKTLWRWYKMGLPVICIDARHAKAALKMQINKSDRNDAVGIARIMQCGWYKEVHVKDLDSHAIKALLVSRALLVKIKRDVENQIRGLLKNLGLVIGRAKMNVFAVRAAELTEDRPELAGAVEPLLKAREAIERQIADLDRKVLRLARNDAQVRRFMTAPGVGAITALCFLATIDDPTRFKRSRSVGAYVGLTTRRYASGEVDWTGRISKCGDKLLRSYLYEAANVLLTRVAKWSALKAWGIRLAKRSGLRKAKVAVARKLAVILHRMWIEGTEFKWSSKEATSQPA
jgi:transposase